MYKQLENDVQQSGLGDPDELHLQIVSIALAVDFINYYDDFVNKRYIFGRFALFKSNILSTELGDIIIINVWNLGKIVIGYNAVKSILEKYVDNRLTWPEQG